MQCKEREREKRVKKGEGDGKPSSDALFYDFQPPRCQYPRRKGEKEGGKLRREKGKRKGVGSGSVLSSPKIGTVAVSSSWIGEG